MLSIRSRLDLTDLLLRHAAIELDCTLQLAIAASCDTQITEAIADAARHTRESSRRIGNIATCIDPTAPLPRSHEP